MHVAIDFPFSLENLVEFNWLLNSGQCKSSSRMKKRVMHVTTATCRTSEFGFKRIATDGRVTF